METSVWQDNCTMFVCVGACVSVKTSKSTSGKALSKNLMLKNYLNPM